MPEHIRVVVFQEGDTWVAQCLEFDIGAQAPTTDILQQRLMTTLLAELSECLRRELEPFEGIDPAPAPFHEMWNRRRSIAFKGDMQVSPAGEHKPVHVELGLCA